MRNYLTFPEVSLLLEATKKTYHPERNYHLIYCVLSSGFVSATVTTYVFPMLICMPVKCLLKNGFTAC